MVPERWRCNGLGLLAVLSFIGLPQLRAADPVSLTAIPPGFTKRILAVQVIDAETGRPIADAQVINSTLQFLAQGDPRLTAPRTDAQGKIEIEILVPSPDAHRQLSDFNLAVEQTNYASRVVYWHSDGGQVMDSLPADYTVKMRKGTPIGGIVKDENGQPLSNAQILVNASGNRGYVTGTGQKTVQEFSQFVSGVLDPDKKTGVFTDNAGKWTVPNFPVDLDSVHIVVVRDDGSDAAYTTDPAQYGASRNLRQISMSELRSQTVVFELPAGFTVRGRVLDAAGAPVSGAKVTEAFGMGNPQPRGRAVTDTEGRFQFLNRRSRQAIWSVDAPGYALTCQVVTMKPDMPETEVRLQPAQPAIVRITLENGQPAVGANLQTMDWRNEGMYLNFQAKADENGLVVWSNAPIQSVRAVVALPGKPTKFLALQAGKDQQIRLSDKPSDEVKITVRAIRAADRAPLPSFEVQLDKHQMRQFQPWTTGTNGVAVGILRSSEFPAGSYPMFVLRVSSSGFLPKNSEAIDFNEGEQEVQFALDADSPIKGLVRLPDGSPAEGAFLVINRERGPVFLNQQFQRGRVRPPSYGNLIKVETGADGAYVLEGVQQEALVLAMHEDGYAQIPCQQLRSDPILTLRSWERLEGTLMIGSQPAKAGFRIGLSPRVYGDGFGVHFDATTEEDGKFVFDKLPAGSFKLFRYFDSKPGTIIESHLESVDVFPGKIAKVQMGGRGVRVEGRAKPNRYVDLDWSMNRHTLIAKPSENAAVPGAGAAWEDFVIRADFEAASRRGMAAPSTPKQYLLSFDSDGSFFVDDVEPGEYVLNIKVTEPPPRSRHWEEGKLIGSLSTNVVIAASANSQAPIDIGLFTLPVASSAPSEGSAAVTVQLLDGKTLELGGTRETPQAIIFWAPWSEQSCQALKEVQESSAEVASSKLLRVAIALEESLAEIEKASQSAAWTGTLAHLTGGNLLKAGPALGLTELPLLMIIDRDGNTILKTSNATRFKDALREVLAARVP